MTPRYWKGIEVISGMAVKPEPNDNYSLISAGIPVSWLIDAQWERSAISVKLSLPIKLIRIPGNINKLMNEASRILLPRCDPEEDRFGTTEFPPIEGDTVVARLNGEELPPRDIEMLVSYIDTNLGAWRQFPHQHVQSRPAARVVAGKMTPQRLAEFFREHEAKGVAEESKDWETAECPVVVPG